MTLWSQEYGKFDLNSAVEGFAEAHSQRPVKRLARGMKQVVEGIFEGAPRAIVDPETGDAIPTAPCSDDAQENEKG